MMKKTDYKYYNPLYSIENRKLNRLTNWTVLIFILFLVPVFSVGLYRTFEESQSAKNRKQLVTIDEKLEAYQQNNIIQSVIEDLNNNINIRNTVTIYALADNTDRINTPRKYYATILNNVGSVNSYKNKRYWQEEIVPVGYEVYNDLVIKNGEYFISNIREREDIYIGSTKDDIDFNNTSSIYGKFLFRDEESKISFLAAIAFEVTNPEVVAPYYKYKFNIVTSEIKNILQDNDE